VTINTTVALADAAPVMAGAVPRAERLDDADTVRAVSYLWLVPTAVLVVGSVVIARLTSDVRSLSAASEVDLAEAAEAIDIIGQHRPELAATTVRLERLVETVGSPVRAVRQARLTVRHWWRRARRTRPPTDVPSRP
jgi:hypothetical protein